MPKLSRSRVKPNPNGVLPGDYLTVEVPRLDYKRYLSPGKYRLTVLSLAAKPDRQAIRVELPNGHRFTASFYPDGKLYLMRDQHPVYYKWEPNLESRLTLSIHSVSKERIKKVIKSLT